MDDTTFDYDRGDVTTMARRYPVRPLAHVAAHPGDVRFLAGAPEPLQHAWDEGGRP
jgi:hypothetical protein